MSSIAFNTLGCRLNQYETDALASDFLKAGYRIVDWNEKADAYVINTCTVTDRSDRKSRALIYQAFRAAQGSAGFSPVIVVTGCFVENEANKLSMDHRVTYAVDNDRKARIFTIVDGHLRGQPVDLENLPSDRFAFGDSSRGFHTRRAIKIQDGCDNYCSFCIIPRVRGRAVSRSFEEVVAQAGESIEAGAKEMVITGVNIGRYRDGEAGFVDLLRRILSLDGDFRVRVSSIEPEIGSPHKPDSWEAGFLELLDHPKLSPHLHLCLQSGSDRILKAMGRRYSASDFFEMADALRRRYPEYNLTTDIIVGFPGETEDDFALTLEAIQRAAFSHVHTFPFSMRPGSRASGMKHQVSYQEKARRAELVRDLSARQKRAYRERMVGRFQRLLIEKMENNVARGYGENYLPIEVSLKTGKKRGAAEGVVAVNTFIDVKLTGLESGEDPVLIGEPCQE